MSPKVSVCVVVYNHARYIQDCLTSVLAQADDVQLEILVGDDQSSDETGDIVAALVEKHPDVIRYFRHEDRIGGTANYQFLIARAGGEYIAHLDGDDFWLPGKLRRQVQILDAHPDCPAAYTNAIAVNDRGDGIGIFNNPQPPWVDINRLLERGNYLNHSSLLYRARLRKKFLCLDHPFLDYRMHLWLAQEGMMAYLNEALVGYRIASGTSILRNANDHIRSLYWEALLDVPRDRVSPDALAGGMAEFMRGVVYRSMRLRRWSLVREWWPTVLLHAPEGCARMSVRIGAAVMRTGFLEALDAIGGYLRGTNVRIFYRR